MRLPALVVSLFLGAPAAAEGLRVVTDIPVTQGLVAAVAGAETEVSVLLEGADDPHDFQLRPSQARALAGADLVVWIGAELTPWLGRALRANAAEVPTLTLLEAEGVQWPERGHVEREDGHDHGPRDPHAWLDPDNAALWTGAIAGALSEADPANAAIYASRAQSFAGALGTLDAELAAILAPVREHRLIFQHDAYGHLTWHYGLSGTLAISDSDGIDPGAGHLAELERGGGAACVFGETGRNTALPERLARDLGAGFAVLDPTGVEVPPGREHYRALMTGLALGIRDCR